MKKIYKIIGIIFCFVILWFIYPIFSEYILRPNPIDCIEWYKNNTGFCDDFSDPLLNIILLILPIIIFILLLIYTFIPSKNKSNEKI